MSIDPPLLSSKIKDFFSRNGALKQNLSAYEYRPGQEKMAFKVAFALEDGKNFIVEAGTGTGKSFAYLVPSILWAVQNNNRVVVSTFTKTLQQQLMRKDIPFVAGALDVDFRYSLCVGGNNYLCKRRLYRAGNAGLFSDVEEARQMEELFRWDKETGTGLRLDLSFQPFPSVWEEVGRQKEFCLGKKCLYQQRCFYQLVRKEWRGAHLLIVNHHLFFANLAGEGGVLPKYHAVIFDEAHQMEGVATSYFGVEVSNTGLNHTLDRLFSPKPQRGLLKRLKGVERKSLRASIQAVEEVRGEQDAFFSDLASFFQDGTGPLRLREPGFIDVSLAPPLIRLADRLKALKKQTLEDDEEDRLEITYFIDRIEDIALGLNSIINQLLPEHVYWLERALTKRSEKISLKGCPIDVSGSLKEALFETGDPVVLTSATLAVNKRFNFICDRLGLNGPVRSVLPSPFRFDRQTLLYTVKEFPDPSREKEKFIHASTVRIKELLKAGSGSAFVLFTSYAMLNRVHDELTNDGLPWRLIKQGDMPQHKALELFKQDKGSVLLGTNSFWEGVDVPGSALSSVIIARLPFAVPTEPLTEARIERIKACGGEPFFQFQVPRAIMMLKQGFGRLIRNMDDTGMVAILDPRLHTKGYGRMFLNSLPKCMETQDIKDVKNFFETMAGVPPNESL